MDSKRLETFMDSSNHLAPRSWVCLACHGKVDGVSVMDVGIKDGKMGSDEL